jgi:hypothetical protein
MFQHEHTEQLGYGRKKSKYKAQTWTDLGFIERLRGLLLISSTTKGVCPIAGGN